MFALSWELPQGLCCSSLPLLFLVLLVLALPFWGSPPPEGIDYRGRYSQGLSSFVPRHEPVESMVSPEPGANHGASLQCLNRPGHPWLRSMGQSHDGSKQMDLPSRA
jgi:hypothetical protein